VKKLYSTKLYHFDILKYCIAADYNILEVPNNNRL